MVLFIPHDVGVCPALNDLPIICRFKLLLASDAPAHIGEQLPSGLSRERVITDYLTQLYRMGSAWLQRSAYQRLWDPGRLEHQ